MDVEATTQIKEVKKAIVVLRELNADDQLRAEAHYREKRLHDEATALGHARREGIMEGTVTALAGLVKDGLLTIEEAAKRSNMSVSDFRGKTGL